MKGASYRFFVFPAASRYIVHSSIPSEIQRVENAPPDLIRLHITPDADLLLTERARFQ